MDPLILAPTVVIAVFVLLILRVPIAFSLCAGVITGMFLFFAWPKGAAFTPDIAFTPVFALISTGPFEFLHSYPLSMIPLFLALGHIAYEAGITTDIYYAMRVWLGRVPGGLAMASVVGCGGFSAITGSSVACAAAMGKIAVPEMLRYKYSPMLASGSVAAGGTLGSLIPPSLLFVLYGIFTEQSVTKLLLAGILPGLISMLGYLAVIYIWVKRNPSSAPAQDLDLDDAARFKALTRTWTAVLLFLIVVLGIYLGVFTPTEAAAVGAVTAALIGFCTRRLTWSKFVHAIKDSAKQTAMIFAIAIGAKMFTVLMSLAGVAPALVSYSADMKAWQVMAVVVVLYLVLGCILDSVGILLLTLPFTVPLVQAHGFDIIWFAIVVVKLLEVGLITPPIGLNVFVIKGVVGNQVPLEAIMKGSLAMICSDIIVFFFVFAFPWLFLVIPNTAL